MSGSVRMSGMRIEPNDRGGNIEEGMQRCPEEKNVVRGGCKLVALGWAPLERIVEVGWCWVGQGRVELVK